MEDEKQTKLCKYCQTEIPQKAKVCPNCRKKQGGKLKWIIISVFAIYIIVMAIGGGDDSNQPSKVGDVKTNKSKKNKSSKKTDSSVDEEIKKKVFKKGEIAELNDVQVTLTDYKESIGSEWNKPADGNLFFMAEFEIANNTNKDLAISSVLSFEAYADDYSLNFSFSALMEHEGNQLDGTIAAGKKLKGWIGWEVPEDYQNIEIHFTDNVWSDNKFVFLIEK